MLIKLHDRKTWKRKLSNYLVMRSSLRISIKQPEALKYNTNITFRNNDLK
jgi:hypothetical protein